METTITYRRATPDDTEGIVHFVDYWLAGRACRDQAPGASNDYFVPKARHEGFLKSHNVLLALEAEHIVGWAVTTAKHSLIHLLVAGDCRGQGVGQEMLRRLNPELVRSKVDQSTGDPTSFYLQRGYEPSPGPPTGAKLNIRMLRKKTESVTLCERTNDDHDATTYGNLTAFCRRLQSNADGHADKREIRAAAHQSAGRTIDNLFGGNVT